MYKSYIIRPGAALLHKLSYSWLRRFQTRQQNAQWIKTAQQEDIYRPKKRCTWTRSTNRTNLTKDTVKRHNSMREDSGVKQQYSSTSIFRRIYQHCTTREQATFTLNHHHTTTPDKQQTTEAYDNTFYPSPFWIKELGNIFGGCNRKSL